MIAGPKVPERDTHRSVPHALGHRRRDTPRTLWRRLVRTRPRELGELDIWESLHALAVRWNAADSAGLSGAGARRAFTAQAPQHKQATSKHGNVEGAEADEQGQLLVGRALVAAGGKRHGRGARRPGRGC